VQGQSQEYVQITSPLNWSVFKYNPSTPQSAQKIWLSFSSNLPYDEAKWTLNGQPFDGKFLEVIPGEYQITISLYQEGILIGTDESNFRIE
jgi:hypothetical protein